MDKFYSDAVLEILADAVEKYNNLDKLNKVNDWQAGSLQGYINGIQLNKPDRYLLNPETLKFEPKIELKKWGFRAAANP